MRFYDIIRKPIFIAKGLATYLPNWLARYLPQHQVQFRGKGVRSISPPEEIARSSYTSWLRFLVLLDRAGMDWSKIRDVAEIGPGDSLGVGLATLLSGAERYTGLDIVRIAYNYQNEKVLDCLVELFRRQSPIPDDNEFPKANPKLSDYAFPSHILTGTILSRSLASERIERLRSELRALESGVNVSGVVSNASINYIVPWDIPKKIRRMSTDLVISVAVGEHIEDIDRAYQIQSQQLRPRGYAAHAIGLNAHNTSNLWNGHWTYSDTVWRIIRGRTAYLINREPHSRHVKLLRKYGFQILAERRITEPSRIQYSDLAKCFQPMSEKDFTTYSAFIIARKIV